MLKSAFKSSSESQVRRQVKFCKTVEIYSYPSGIDEGDSESFDCVDDVTVERREVDDDGDVLSEKPEDFLVHKVVYSDFEELFPGSLQQDVGTDSDDGESVLYYPPETESEVQEFVVHCVNKLEKEKNGASKTLEDEDKVCTLSIENIEQHNKLTESDIHIDTDLEVPSSLFGSAVTLSPPLQDLGIERLICPQSDKWFWELDISPLNSTQETDSGSNPSSEDTMIMMTSEECEKNEKRIQESLQKFESLRKLKSSVQESVPEGQPGSETIEVNSAADSLLESPLVPERSDSPSGRSEACDQEVSAGDGPPCNISLDDSLVSIQIPEDVREWKIEVKEPGLDGGGSSPGAREGSGRASVSLPDELESFVHECTERVERIKKRYSISEKPLWSARRGIRPRFGSTAHILQQMRASDPPPAANPHHSWPCYSAEPGSYFLAPAPELPSCDAPLADWRRSPPSAPRWSFSCDSKRGAPSPVLSERGAPEGSSPPPLPSPETKNQNEPHSDSVIYYSMKV